MRPLLPLVSRRRYEARVTELELRVKELKAGNEHLKWRLNHGQTPLRRAYEQLWSAALALSALLETEWPHGWPEELRRANAEVRRLTDDPDARAEGDNG